MSPKVELTPLHRFLHRLAGEWAGGETIAPSPWDPSGASASATVLNQIALDGTVVIQDYLQRRGEAVALEGHGVFGVEGAEVVLRWWDNWSPTPREFRGGVEGDTLQLISRDAKGAARATWHLGAEEYRYTLEVPQGEGWYRYMEATYRRS